MIHHLLESHRMFYAPLLFPAARATCQPEHFHSLAQQAAAVTDWQGFIAYAEEHSLAPLFYYHARAAGLTLPAEIQLQLQGLSLRHQFASQARLQALHEIIPACQAAGVDLLLLKGAALAPLAYPQPALRPMRDLDLLTRPAQARALQRLLADLGFQPAPEHAELASPHHLPSLSRQVGEFKVTIEVHYNLFDPAWRARPPRIDRWIDQARPFNLDGLSAYTLSLEEMLWHIYQHMINSKMRLVSVADLVSLSEQYAAEIDWDKIRRAYPAVIQALALFQPHAPLSPALVQAARVPTGSRAVPIGEDLQGWPRLPLRRLSDLGWGQFLKQTFLPSEWWLRLYFGIKNERAISVYRWIAHPLEILRIAIIRLALRRYNPAPRS